MSALEIAAVFGVSVSCVCRALNREQLMIHTRPADNAAGANTPSSTPTSRQTPT